MRLTLVSPPGLRIRREVGYIRVLQCLAHHLCSWRTSLGEEALIRRLHSIADSTLKPFTSATLLWASTTAQEKNCDPKKDARYTQANGQSNSTHFCAGYLRYPVNLVQQLALYLFG